MSWLCRWGEPTEQTLTGFKVKLCLFGSEPEGVQTLSGSHFCSPPWWISVCSISSSPLHHRAEYFTFHWVSVHQTNHDVLFYRWNFIDRVVRSVWTDRTSQPLQVSSRWLIGSVDRCVGCVRWSRCLMKIFVSLVCLAAVQLRTQVFTTRYANALTAAANPLPVILSPLCVCVHLHNVCLRMCLHVYVLYLMDNSCVFFSELSEVKCS